MRRLFHRTATAACCLLLPFAALCPSPAGAQVALATAAISQQHVRIAEAVEVKVSNRPVVVLRAAIGELDPRRRAANIAARLDALPHSALRMEVRPVAAQLGEIKGYYILVGTHNIMGLLPEDLDPESGLSLEQYAKDTAQRLHEALLARAEQRDLPLLMRAVGLSVAATLVFALAAWGVARARGRMLSRIQVKAPSALGLMGVNVAPALTALERGVVKLMAVSLIVIAAYLWLTFVFVQFPLTEPWGEGLGHYLGELLLQLGRGAVGAVPGLFTVMVIFVLTRIVTRAVSAFFLTVERGEITLGWMEPDSARATRRVAVALIWLFALTVAYPYIPGSGTDAFKGVSVFAGLMISLGSAGLINQLMSGLVVVYSRALRPGDLVRVGDTMGVVNVVGVLSTKIVTGRREEVTLPHAVVVANKVVNYTRMAGDDGVMFTTTVTIGYDAPWRQVHALLLEAARKTEGIRAAPAPYVLQRALSDFYVEYELRFHLERPEGLATTLSALHANIQDSFNEHGVQIMSPHFESQPEREVVVPPARWYAPPAVAPAGESGARQG